MTDRQAQISQKLTEYVSQDKSVLVEAVCGAGKTEIVFQMISDQLRKGRKVGFSIARRQVVLEIAHRLKDAFPFLTVRAVCGGYTKKLNGDLIVCTTHQLFRYNSYFDVLIIDEPDAFPFKNNDLLKGFAQRSYKKSIVYLTATPDDYLIEKVQNKEIEHLFLSKRPHNHPLVIPKVVYGGQMRLWIYGITWLKRQLKNSRQVIWFVPSRRLGIYTFLVLKLICNCCSISSQTKEKDSIIRDFRSGKYQVCISTTILERGVTIPGVNVLVFDSDHQVFDDASLNQISGRVGRSFNCPDGECLFLARKRSESIDKCLKALERANND